MLLSVSSVHYQSLLTQHIRERVVVVTFIWHSVSVGVSFNGLFKNGLVLFL